MFSSPVTLTHMYFAVKEHETGRPQRYCFQIKFHYVAEVYIVSQAVRSQAYPCHKQKHIRYCYVTKWHIDPIYICKVLQRRYNSLSFAISPIEALYIYIIYHNFPTAIQTISPT